MNGAYVCESIGDLADELDIDVGRVIDVYRKKRKQIEEEEDEVDRHEKALKKVRDRLR